MKEKKPINIEVGQHIKQCREAVGLTQERFAELIGLGVKHVSAIECGAVGASLSTLKRASIVLSVPADVLLFGETDESERLGRTSDLHVIVSRLSRLPPGKFRVVKDIVDKLLEALAMED